MKESTRKTLEKIEIRLSSFSPDPGYPHDEFILIAVKEALAAAVEGNFGVGAVLVRGKDEIVERGRNRVFHPSFRSDLHAEMDVMTKFEKRFGKINSMKGYTLFVSLEPCPMCLLRLIISGVQNVFYAAVDERGGMVHRFEHVPPEWRELAEKQKFEQADCSPELKNIALDIFLATVNDNDRRLMQRRK